MRLKPRFSLRSLLLAVLTLAAGATLYQNFAPWRVEREFLGARDTCFAMNISSDGKWIAGSESVEHPTDTDRNHLYMRNSLWNVESGEHTVLFEFGLNNYAWFSPDSTWLETGLDTEGSKRLVLRNLRSNAELKFGLTEQANYAMIGFSPDSRYLVLADYKAFLKLIDLQTGKVLATRHETPFLFSKTGAQLALLEPDGSIVILESATGREVQRIPRPTDWEFHTLRHFSESHFIAEGFWTEEYWDVGLHGHTIHFNPACPAEVTIMPGKLETMTRDESLAFFHHKVGIDLAGSVVVDLRTLKPLFHLKEAFGPFYLNSTNTLALDRIGLGVYDIRTGERLYKLEHSNFAMFAPSGTRFLVSDSNTKTLRIHDLKSGARLATLDREYCNYNSDQSFMPDGERFMTQNYDTRAIHLWRRHRPEQWWGFAWLPEFWITLALAGGLLWSLRRDWREGRAGKSAHAP